MMTVPVKGYFWEEKGAGCCKGGLPQPVCNTPFLEKNNMKQIHQNVKQLTKARFRYTGINYLLISTCLNVIFQS